MIKIKRPPLPSLLKTEMVQKANRNLKASYEDSSRQDRLKFDTRIFFEIKPVLMDMCYGKCAYCDSRLGVVSYGDVENFRPKAGARGMDGDYSRSHYWWLAYEWDNLLISCQICNQKYKRDIFPLADGVARSRIGALGEELLLEQPMLIDPTTEDPDEHLVFTEDGMVEAKTKKGKCTIEVLGLNRAELINNRKDAAKAFSKELDAYRSAKPKTKENDPAYLISENPRREYIATLRTVYTNWLKKNGAKKSRSATRPIGNVSSPSNQSPAMVKKISNVEEQQVSAQVAGLKRFSIKSVEISNFKSIEHLVFDLLPSAKDGSGESCFLVLGDNGIGKSSILQALSLTLAGSAAFESLELDVSDFLKYGTDSGYVRVWAHEQDAPIELTFNQKGFHLSHLESPTFILGYGSTRLLPKGVVQPKTEVTGYVNITNLFDYTVSLCDPNQWLAHVNETELRERVIPALFEILDLREDDLIYLEKGRVQIAQHGMTHKLEDVSDGYKTVIALVTDIMKTLSIDGAGYHNAQGLVLIDEIGNHLHPRWRLRIAGALRRAFPKLQFIVTSHEPLCLRGLSHGEVAVLVRDNEKNIRMLDSRLLPDHNLMSIDQLLTSDLFGLIDIMDSQMERTYEEYYRLLSKKESAKTDEDKERIQQMAAVIEDKEMLGTTPIEQVEYQVIKETFAKHLNEHGFRATEEIKKETVNEVKAMLKTKKYKWL